MPDQFLHGVEVVQIDGGIRPIRTVKSSIIGMVGTADGADAGAFPLNTPVLIKGPNQAALLGADGTLKDSYLAAYEQGVNAIVVVRVEEGADAAATEANVVGAAADSTGVYALLTAENVTGQEPRILAAPGHTIPAAANAKSPVAVALETAADRLKATAVVDGPNTNEADALNYAALFGLKRTFCVDPHVRVYDSDDAAVVTRPTSGFVAGIISNNDNERGYWHSPSNTVMKGVVGTHPAHPFFHDPHKHLSWPR